MAKQTAATLIWSSQLTLLALPTTKGGDSYLLHLDEPPPYFICLAFEIEVGKRDFIVPLGRFFKEAAT